jgi:hypothetical protein
MKRILGHGLTLLGVALAATTFTPACEENDQSIFIRGALAPAQNRLNGICVYTDDPEQAQLFEGTFDVAVRDSYILILLVGNQLIARGDTANVRAESNRVHLNGAIVRVTDPNGALIGEFTSLGSGFADPQNSNTPAFGSIAVTGIDAPTQARIGGGLAGGQTRLVVANVKVFGRTLGGNEIETGEFQLPIRVCNGCLISFAGGDDPATPGVDCNLPIPTSGAGGGTVILPCRPGQDELTPCQACLDRPACRTR